MDYETIMAHKRARRAALREAGKKARVGGAHRNKARYNRKRKYRASFEEE